MGLRENIMSLCQRTSRRVLAGCLGSAGRSLSRRWLIEKSFAWLKQTGPLRQTKLRGLGKVDWLFVFSCGAHNLLRLPKLFAVQQTPMFRAQAA